MQSGERILVVEDDADARALIARILTDAGAQVFEVGSADAAMSRIKAETPDLLVAYRGDKGTGKSGYSNIGGMSSFDNPAYSSVPFTEQSANLMVDLLDAGTKTLAWRLYIDQSIQGPNDPPDKMQKALAKGFEKYPPSASAIAKKAKALEKESK